jgi:hypothetical protein
MSLWNKSNRGASIHALRCPSDPSYGTSGHARDGMVYANSSLPWVATNYVGNWNIFSADQPASAGYAARPQKFANVTDGLSNTIMLAEAYAWCETRGRTAFLAWHIGTSTGNAHGGFLVPRNGTHNFGITFNLESTQIDNGTGAANVNVATGLPNPRSDLTLNFFFQVRPDPVRPGANGCTSLTVQTGHDHIQIAMGDGSVRSFGRGFDRNAWALMMLPNDGQAVSFD